MIKMKLPVKIITPCANLADAMAIKPLHSKLTAFGYEAKIVMGCYVDTNRNRGVSGNNQRIKQTFQDGITVFIDSDIECDVEDVHALVDAAYSYDIIGVPYRTQKDDGFDCCRNKIGSKTGIVEVAEIGFGLIAVRNSVFNKMSFPYFQRPVVKKDGCADLLGEDLYFCREAHKLGFKIYAHYWINIKHHIRKEQLMSTPEGKAEVQMPQKVQVPLDLDKWVINMGKQDAQINDWYQQLVGEVKKLQEENAKLKAELKKVSEAPKVVGKKK